MQSTMETNRIVQTINPSEENSFDLDLDVMENFFNKDLNISEIVLNEEALSVIEPSESNKMSIMGLSLTKTLKQNKILKSEIDRLQSGFAEFKINTLKDSVSAGELQTILRGIPSGTT